MFEVQQSSTHVVADVHWQLGREYHVLEGASLVNNLLHHVTGGHLHWECDGGRRVGGHHAYSRRT